MGITIWMMISCQGVECIKWVRNKTWIDGEYYRENILKEFVVTDERLKKSNKDGFMFQQDHAPAHKSAPTLSLLHE